MAQGLVLEVSEAETEEVLAAYAAGSVPCYKLGSVVAADVVKVVCSSDSAAKRQKTDGGVDAGAIVLLDCPHTQLAAVWEATSFELEKLQCDADCVGQEQASVGRRAVPDWKLSYTPEPTKAYSSQVAVAILRTEGSNGDREMTASFHLAGFKAWDVTVSDLAAGKIELDQFRGLAMVGGFSYADTLDSAKGWAGSAKFHPKVRMQLAKFFARCAAAQPGLAEPLGGHYQKW
jgi:phosphoribosylformylglycinamidine synthase